MKNFIMQENIKLILQRVRRFFNKFLLNGAFITEIMILLLTRSNIKATLAKIDNTKINEELLGIFLIELIVINILFSFSQKISIILKKLQYLLLMGIISYYIVYTIGLIIISSEIRWNINTFGIFILSLVLDLVVILYSSKFTKYGEFTVALLILSHLGLVLLFSLAIAIDIRNWYHYNPLYLICSISILVLLLVCCYRFKLNMTKYFKKIIHSQVIDIVISFLFVVFFVVFLAALVLEYRSSLRELFNEWVPLVSLAISIGIILLIYLKHIKEIVTDTFVIYYFEFWAIVPLILFVLYFQRNNIGNYTTFKGLLGIILAVDAFVLLAFSKDMKVLLTKFENENNLIKKTGAPYTIAKLKLVLSNITILVTLLNAVFSKKEVLMTCVSNISNFFYKVSIPMNNYFKNNSFEVVFSNKLFEDEKFKIILFMFGLVGVLLFLSWLLFKIEKCIFVNMLYRKL